MAKIIAFGGGKGGIGKSVITANVANMLSHRGRRILVADFDLGGSNLHTILGITPSGKTLHNFVTREEKSFKNIIFRPQGYFFDFLPGLTNSVPDITIPAAMRQKIIRHLKKLNYDYILIDLGAGINPHVLDFFNIDQGVVVTIPEPTGIENLYRFFRSAFTRKIFQIKSGTVWKKLVKSVLDKPKSFYKSDVDELLDRVEKIFPELVGEVKKVIENFNPWLIMNMAGEDDFGSEIPLIVDRLLGLKITFLGEVNYDPRVTIDIRKKQLTSQVAPESAFTRSLYNIVEKMLKEGTN